MQREIKVGTISWINDSPNPMYTTGQAVTLAPDWIPKTYLGLSATSNPAPPTTLRDFKSYQRAKDFRALTYCHFAVDVDDGTDSVSRFSVFDAAHDGGWTPAFKMRSWPSTVFSFDTSIFSTTWHQGEYSPLSVVCTQSRHPNATITGVPNNENVLVNALIKFRAGTHTDNIGVNEVHSPFHVPWVWCEMLLTYTNGHFKMYGNGSIFPSHAWYFNSSRIMNISQVSDAVFPVTSGRIIPAAQLKIYPVLSVGAPAGSPQAPLDGDRGKTDPVHRHPYTATGREPWSLSVW